MIENIYNNPYKIIYKVKNNNRRDTYYVFIFVGNVPNEIKKILNKIKYLLINELNKNLSRTEMKKMENYYGKFWYKYFYNIENIKQNLFDKKEKYEEKIVKKLEPILRYKIKEDDEKILNDYKIKKGGELEEDEEDEEKEIIEKEIEEKEPIEEKKLTQIDVQEEIDVEEMYKLYEEEIDKKKLKDENRTLKDIFTEEELDQKMETIKEIKITYNQELSKIYEKYYIFKNYIYNDDTIEIIKNKITDSIKTLDIFSKVEKHESYIIPQRIYLWINYTIEENTKLKKMKVSLGFYYTIKNSILEIDNEPLELHNYENLSTNFVILKENLIKKRIKFNNKYQLILKDYDNYITNNEIFMIDIYNEIGLNYNNITEKINNIFDTYIKIYFPLISRQEFYNIIDYVNEKNQIPEIESMNNYYNSIKNEILLYNEIMETVNKIKLEHKKYDKLFDKINITHIFVYTNPLTYKYNFTNLEISQIDLFRIFDNFTINDEYIGIIYRTGVDVFYKTSKKYYKEEENKDEIIKALNIQIKGLTIKIINKQFNKVLNVNIYNTGKIEYKMQWKEEEKMSIEYVKETYNIINKLIEKINREAKIFNLNLLKEENFYYNFINIIQKTNLEKYKKQINHNDLSEFARLFFPYITVNIDPKKRKKKIESEEKIGKYGTYLRYKRISNYFDKSKIDNKILHYLKNYDISLNDIAEQISKQFNIIKEKAIEFTKNIKLKYKNIKTKKKLKTLSQIISDKMPGIGIDIQGKQINNYKIRITGIHDITEMNNIIKFIKIVIYLYSEIYIKKNKKYKYIKEKLKKINDIARRKNKVVDFIIERGKKKIKSKIELDPDRLGYKSNKTDNNWSRKCQNSGKRNRQPDLFNIDNIQELENFGYKNINGKYKKEIIHKNKKLILQAFKLKNKQNENIYYSCNLEINNEYIHIGFLSKKYNDMCLPCCFKKNQFDSKKKNEFNEKCLIDDVVEEQHFKKSKFDKLYIMQSSKKLETGRIAILPHILDKFFNQNNKFLLKYHYLINSENGYYFLFGNGYIRNSLLYSIILAADDIDNIYDKIEKKLKTDEKYFIYITNGNVKIKYKTIENFMNYIKNDNIDEEIIKDLIEYPGIIRDDGINLITFKENIETEKQVEDYVVECNSEFNMIKDFIFVLKNNKTYYPIINIIKNNKRIEIKKIFNFKEDVIINLKNYYNLRCKKMAIIEKKQIEYEKINVKYQYVDEFYKLKYYITENEVIIPTINIKLNPNIKIIKDYKKYIKNAEKTIDELKKYNIELIGLIYEKNNVTYIKLNNELKIPIKLENKENFKKYKLEKDEEISKKIVKETIKNKVNIIKKKEENYNLLKYEFSNYINNIKREYKYVLENVINKNENDLYKVVKKIIKEIIEKTNKVSMFEIRNYRDLCNIKGKHICDNQCIIKNNKCKFNMYNKWEEEFINKIVFELKYIELRRNEILKMNNNFVSDIINKKIFKENENEIIVITNELKYGEYEEEIKKDEITNIVINNKNVQEILKDKQLTRAISNGIYYINNEYDENNNLGYYNKIQDIFINIINSNIIDYLKKIDINKAYKFVRGLLNEDEKITIIEKIYNIGIDIYDEKMNKIRQSQMKTKNMIELMRVNNDIKFIYNIKNIK